MGRRIKTLPAARDLSRQLLAQKASMSRETIGLLELGKFDPTGHDPRPLHPRLEPSQRLSPTPGRLVEQERP